MKILLTSATMPSLASFDAQADTGLDVDNVRPFLQRLAIENAAKVEGQKRGTRYIFVKGATR